MTGADQFHPVAVKILGPQAAAKLHLVLQRLLCFLRNRRDTGTCCGFVPDGIRQRFAALPFVVGIPANVIVEVSRFWPDGKAVE